MVKWPSAYAHHILTDEGSITRDADNQTLPCGVPGMSMAEAIEDSMNTPQYSMSASILAGTESRKKAEDWGAQTCLTGKTPWQRRSVN